ncbi:VirB4 family type IV secretion/conjugal transfer ATPase [Undibacterium sp.]|uniref:VirB4 family type IV secretion/conjugal transfer ATPase n=1 Tax=Undibacterium sp. TaxID=1914977 RepID=UPI003751DABB
MGATVAFADVANKEVSNSEFIPQGNHVTRNTVKLVDGGYMQTMRLQGAAHESADPEDINAWHNQLNNFLKNIASPHVAVWTHTVRRRHNEYPSGEFKNTFCRELNEKYRLHMSGEVMRVNELYVTLIYQPEPVKAARFLDFLIPKDSAAAEEDQRGAIRAIDDVVSAALASLDRYDPELLGCYEHNGYVYSEVGEFLSYLVNGEWQRFPLSKSSIKHILATSRPFFGKGGQMALKAPSKTHFASILYIQEYPDITHPGLLNNLLSLPCDFVLSQSFTFLSKPVAVGRMKRQQSRMVNAGDVAESQVEEISDALDGLVSNHFVLGAHNMALVIKALSAKELKDLVTLAGTALSDNGMKWALEDWGIAGAFWSQLPGNFKYRTRIADMTSRNFAGFASFHNYPIGHIRHNQWGDAVCMFQTTSGAPYYFNFHKGENGADAKRAAKLDPEHKDLANTIVIGKSGSGKTVLEMFLLAQITKFDNERNKLSAVLFDKDLGASIGVRAMGGKYFPIKNGVKTGWNPVQLPITPNNLTFVDKLVRQLVKREDRLISAREEREISRAIAGVMNETVPLESRRLSSILEFFDPTDDDGLHIRLSRWCRGGDLGWLFDNESDTLDLSDCNIVGFDVTEFLDNAETRTPTILYLLHRIEGLIDGRRIPIFMDEFWKLLNDPAFEELAGNKLVTIRKQDGFLVMFTQYPEQVLRSPIASAIISQTATQIYLPNPQADFDDYVNGFKTTVREWEIIRSLGEKSRQFLIKQGENSVVAELNLRGFGDELAVLSGNTATAGLATRVIEKLGNNPDVWLPEFQRIRKGE